MDLHGSSVPIDEAYGPEPDQGLRLHLPEGEPPVDGWPAVALLHGGFWRQPYRAELMTPLARDLALRGVAAANLEYRRVRGAGGWPATLVDVAAGFDHLAAGAGGRIDPDRVALVGHSAGGHLALWSAARHLLPSGAPGASPRLHASAVVALAPVADLEAAHAAGLSDGAVAELLEGGPAEVPERFAVADPLRLVGHGVATLLVHGTRDGAVPVAQSRAYQQAADAAGGDVQLRLLEVDHMELIDPASEGWTGVVDWLVDRLRAGASKTAPR